MKKEQRREYGKPMQSVIRMYTDPQYYLRKYAAVGNREIELLEHKAEGDRFSIKVRFKSDPKLQLPGIARKFVSGTQTIVQEDRWDFAKGSGQLLVDIHGLPIDVSAQMKLSEVASGAINLLHWDVRCAVPLIGGKLEEIMLAEVQARMQDDLHASQKILADYCQ